MALSFFGPPKCAEIPNFAVFLNINQIVLKNGQKWYLLTFCKTQVIWKTFCCNPQIHPKLVFSDSSLLKDKNIAVDQNTQLGYGKTKIRKSDLKDKTRQETEKQYWWNIVWFNILMLLISWNKTKEQGKETKRQRQDAKESKKERKQGRKKEITRQRQRKREWKGGGEKTREKQRETLKNKQKCPFSGETGISFKKETKTKRNDDKKQQKEGLGPSEVALWAASPDP